MEAESRCDCCRIAGCTEGVLTPKREKGEGSIYQRGLVWWVAYSHRGRVYRESSGSAKQGDATKLLRRRLSELASGTHAPHAEKVTFEDLAAIVADDYRVNQRRSTVRMLRSFAHLREVFADYRAVDITADRLRAYLRTRLDQGAAPASVQNELAALKRGFALAVADTKLHLKPAFPTIRVSNARAGFFEEAEFRAVCAELVAKNRDALVAPLTFAYLTGWRLADEVLTLKWSQVDLSAGVVRLEPGTTKNDEGREWPTRALPELHALLTTQLEHTRSVERQTGSIVPHVFHRRGHPIKSLRGAFAEACARAGVDRIPHDFRRTAVRNLERAGVPRSVAMKLVGHKTEAIYRRYAIVSQRDLAEGVAKLATMRLAPSSERVSAAISHISRTAHHG